MSESEQERKLVRCPKCEAILEVDEKGIAREVEWWELLIWSKMKKTFYTLPPELRNKIRLKFREQWMYDEF
jgi:hypothetical protein